MSSLHSESYNQKIQEPNYTPIPNVVFDYWMPRLSLAAQSILFAICRKTFGWKKTSDTISKNQLIKATGISKNTIQKAIEELESYNLLIKHSNSNEYGNQPNTYYLNVDKPLDSDEEGTQKLGGDGSNSDLGVGQILTPQKKDLQKKQTTTTKKVKKKEKVGGVVLFEKNLDQTTDEEKMNAKEIAEKFKKFASEKDRNRSPDWEIPEELILSLIADHGMSYVIEQCQYIYNQQIRAEKDEIEGVPKKTPKIDKPRHSLLLACSRNYALAKSQKKK